ncbi:MAG: ABC-2 family transporter protein [Anaerolineales bacterium]|nr:ABC-2 family transporter protein [Anaerolineales bacterium]
MGYYLRLIGSFARASAQAELAYRANFWISLLSAGLNLGSGVLGLLVIFGQVETVNGWDLNSTLAILGVYLTVGNLGSLFFGPSLEALSGMDGEVWTGQLDFTLLRPLDVQFQASFRHWRPLAMLDLALGLGVIAVALLRLGQSLTLVNLLAFALTLLLSVLILYAILLLFAALVFWSPGFLFTWVFNGIFQMARYPLGLYPGWVRLLLTWVVPVGVITTVPVQALRGDLAPGGFLGALLVAAVLLSGASWLFRAGLRRYASASS